jgi:two-component system sensor histidine kinase KdpD
MVTTTIVTLMTIVFKHVGLTFDLVNIALIYLLPVLLNAVYWGLRPAFFAAVLGVLSFDFFFVPPFLSFTVADLRYVISFGVFLSVAALTASLAARLKQQLRYSQQKESHTALLYGLSKQIGAISDIPTLLHNISMHVTQAIGTEIAIYLPDRQNKLTLSYKSAMATDWGQGDAELVIAKWVFEHGETAGLGTPTLSKSSGYYVPLRTEDRIDGVLALNLKEGSHEISSEQQQLFEALGGLAATAISRIMLAEEAKIAHLTAESERLRSAILDSVSHEMRTPLAAIIGSATGLIESEHLFSSEDRLELLTTIRDGALRMNRLVKNLLSMAQLESGMLRLKKHWCDAADLIGVALSQVKDFQQHRKLHVKLPETVPMVLGDEVLLEQVLVNVLSNAIKYSPSNSEIVLAVSSEKDSLVISVSDQGIDLTKEEYARIFDKFYRAEATRQVTGTGLGLSICKGIVELHGGTISAERNEPQGTIVTIRLPAMQEEQPLLHIDGRENANP